MKWYLALTFVLALQMLMYLSAYALETDLNPNATISGSGAFETYNNGNYTLKGNINDFLPTAQGSVDPDTGQLYTDDYTTGKVWLKDNTQNTNFITAPRDILISLGLEPYVAFAISTFWYLLVGALVLYQFLRGGA